MYQDAFRLWYAGATTVARPYDESDTIDYGRVTIDTVELRQRPDMTRYQHYLRRRTTNWYELIRMYYDLTRRQ